MTPFVGRAAQLAAASSIVSALGTRAVLVTGEPGSGKSRLLGEIVRGLPSGTCLRVQGYEPEAMIPLAGAAGALDHLASHDERLATALATDASAQL